MDASSIVFDNVSRSGIPLILTIIALSMLSCGKPQPTLEGIDISKWKEDRNACGNFRLSVVDYLDKQKDKLLALSEMDIVGVLGKPDINRLSDRNQKFYYYFLQPAKACGNTTDELPARLAIRFNAMGLAKEVRVEREYEGANSVNQ